MKIKKTVINLIMITALGLVPTLSGAASEVKYDEARALFLKGTVPDDSVLFSPGRAWECLPTPYKDDVTSIGTELLRLTPVGFGYTMLVNDVPIGNRKFMGSVWMSQGSGFESVDSEGYSCPSGNHKNLNYTKRVVRATEDGKLVLEWMTGRDGACLPNNSSYLQKPTPDDMTYPEAISDPEYRARQYFICNVSTQFR